MLKNLLLTVSLQVLMTWGGLFAQGAIEFFEGSPEELQAKARQEHRPYLLYIYMEDCGPCDEIENGPLSHPRILEYLKTHNFLVGRVNGSQKWRGPGSNTVRMFPTLILVNPEGEVVYQKAGYVGYSQLEIELRTIAPPVLQSAQATQTFTALPSPPKQQEASPQEVSTPRPRIVEPQTTSEEQYAIQVIVYSDYELAHKMKAKLQGQYSNPVLLKESQRNGSTLIHVLVGPFDTRESAMAFKRGYDWDHTEGSLLKKMSEFY